MANLTTVDDLRVDALLRAGEPQSSSSGHWVQSLVYMNRIQRDLMLGGLVAVGRDLATSAGIYDHLVTVPMTDWWWARKAGVLNTTVGRNADTVTLTEGSASGTLGATVTGSLAGYRLQIPGVATVPIISTHSSGTAAITLDAAWPETTTTATCNIFKLTAGLATDFLRFASRPYVHNTWSQGISVGALDNRGDTFPLTMIPQGAPTSAFLTAPQTVEVNAWDTRAYRFEYEYIALPADLVAGAGTTILPPHHRAVLSIGTAMCIAHDKGDDRAKTFASEFREMVMRMMQEHRRMISGGSARFGQFNFRQGSGLRSQQRNGELFLV